MAGNVELTPNVFAKLVLMNLGRDLYVCKNMNHDVTQEFAQKNNKIGSSVMVRKPYRFTVSKGLTYQPQPVVDTQTPVTVSQVAQVAFDWNSVEKCLSVREANALYAVPAGIALASQINREAATFIADNTFNSVGTLGTAPTSQTTYLNAGDLLVAQGLPNEEQKNLCLIINRKMSSAYVNGVAGVFNPQSVVSQQIEKGEIVNRLFGYRIEQDQTINRHTTGTYSGSPLANSATAQTGSGGNNGTMSVITDGWGSGVSALKKGDVITFGSATSATVGGVNSVHPQTKVDTGYQQQFTVLADVNDTTGAMTILVAPAATPVTIDPQYANVTGGIVDNAIITVVSATGVVGDQGLLMHMSSFAFVSVPMEAPDPGEGALVTQIRDDETGIAIRIIKAFDYINSRHINRMDVLYDFSPLYREMAVKIQG